MTSEKKLFFSLWSLLLLLFFIWRFWPVPQFEPPPISLELGQELATWFSHGTVIRSEPSRLEVQLNFKKGRGQKRPERILVTYQLQAESRSAFEGTVECSPTDDSFARLTLPNPNRIAAQRILLFLAR